MKRIIALALLVFCGTALQAAPLVFTNTLYLTDALALAGTANDTQSDSSPPTAFPLLTIAAVDTDTASASAAGSADVGFLGSAASASSTVDPASALASSEFIGDFVALGGAIRLLLNFDTLNNGTDGANADSSILLTLIADGETFLNEVFNTAQSIDRLIALPGGALATLAHLSQLDIENGGFRGVMPWRTAWLLGVGVEIRCSGDLVSFQRCGFAYNG